MKSLIKFFLLWIAIGFGSVSFATTQTNIQMIDAVRNRKIPVAIYESTRQENLPIVIINHGYTIKNTEYSFIANQLADLGYFIVSIQHDMPEDPPLPKTDNIFERRKPMWERGVQNILFVIETLKKEKPHLNSNQMILIGHSGGGDISMMLGTQYPERVLKIISLDSLRYPFSVDKSISILHFSSEDKKPDPGVIPDKGVQTIRIKGVKHIDLCDRGESCIKDVILKFITQFLKK